MNVSSALLLFIIHDLFSFSVRAALAMGAVNLWHFPTRLTLIFRLSHVTSKRVEPDMIMM